MQHFVANLSNGMNVIKAWHFVGDTLRGGMSIPPNGEKLIHTDPLGFRLPLKICKSGLHASKRLIDALEYAPGATICRVCCEGEIIYMENKLACTERTILWRVDGEKVLYDFARRCALSVVSKWYAPDVVIRWLKTGDEKFRCAAKIAAEDKALNYESFVGRSAALAVVKAARRKHLTNSWTSDNAWTTAWSTSRMSARILTRDLIISNPEEFSLYKTYDWQKALYIIHAKQNRCLTAMVSSAEKL